MPHDDNNLMWCNATKTYIWCTFLVFLSKKHDFLGGKSYAKCHYGGENGGGGDASQMEKINDSLYIYIYKIVYNNNYQKNDYGLLTFGRFLILACYIVLWHPGNSHQCNITVWTKPNIPALIFFFQFTYTLKHWNHSTR